MDGLGRIGLDAIAGHLQWGMTEWKSQGLPVGRVPQISVHDLATMKDERPDLVVVDVREPFEWDEGHIDGALHLPMGEALARKDLVPAGRPKAVVCAGGLRSSLGDQRAEPRRLHRLLQRHRRHDRVAEGRLQHGEALTDESFDYPVMARALILGDKDTVARKTQEGLALSMDPKDLIFRGLIPGMDVVGEKFRRNEYYVPQVLLSARAMYAGLDLLKPLDHQGGRRRRRTWAWS